MVPNFQVCFYIKFEPKLKKMSAGYCSSECFRTVNARIITSARGFHGWVWFEGLIIICNSDSDKQRIARFHGVIKTK